MDSTGQRRVTRRDAIAGAARYAAAGGMVILSAGLVVKGCLVPEESRCSVAAGCRGCGARADCGLPAAEQFRRDKGE